MRRTEPAQQDSQDYIQKSAFLLGYKYTECRGMSHNWQYDNQGLRPYHVNGTDNPRQVLELWYPCARKGCDVVKKLRYLPVENKRRGKYQPKWLLVEDSTVIDYPADGSYRADPGMDLRGRDCRQFQAQRMFANVDLKALGWELG